MPTLPPTVDFFSPFVWRRFLEEAPVNQTYIGDNYLPFEDTPSDRIEYDMIQAGYPLAPFVAVGAESPLIDHEQITKRWAEIVFVRFKGALNEHDVRLIKEIQQAPNVTPAVNAMRTAAMARIARLKLRLNRSVDARVEWMRIKALLGGMVITPVQGNAQEGTSNIQFTVSYPIQSKSASADGSGYWTDATNADPIKDFQDWFLNSYWQPGEVISSKQALMYIMRMQKVRDSLFQNMVRTPTTLTAAQAQTYIQDVLGIKWTTYDSMYYQRSFDGTKWTNTPTRFLPTNKIIVLPNTGERIGYFATAPSPYDPGWGTGKFSWDFDPLSGGQLKEPLIWETGVGIYGLPILEYPDRVMSVQIAA